MSEHETHARQSHDEYEGGDDIERDVTTASDRQYRFVTHWCRSPGLVGEVIGGWFHGLLLGEILTATSIMGVDCEDDLGRQ